MTVDQDSHPAPTTGDAASSGSTIAVPGAVGIERRGIQHVTADERWGTPSALFWMWSGAIWNVEYVVYGTILVAFVGLSFAQAVPIIIVGCIGSYLLPGSQASRDRRPARRPSRSAGRPSARGGTVRLHCSTG